MNKTRDVRWMGHVSRAGKRRNAYWVFGGETKETTCKTWT
jgi:hypothetical protein